MPAQATKKPRCRGARKLQYRIRLMEAEYLLFQSRRSRGVHHGKRSPPPEENPSRPGDRGGRIDRRVAQENGVSERTAFYWAKDPKVRREVEACRRRALNQAIGRLTGMTTKAADRLSTLAQEADSESVQLRASRAVLADQIAVAKFSDLEYRMAEIEQQLSERTGHTHPAR